MAASRFLITGRVQGVGFRAATQAQARSLGLSGWARNRRDGRVEVLVAGPAEAVAAMRDWLTDGPPLAQVDQVKESPAEPPPETSFGLRASI